MRSVSSFQGPPGFATPSRPPHIRDALERPVSGRRKRSASPPSIAEAAEIASLHRRSMKPRTAQHHRQRAGAHLGSTFTPEEMEDLAPTTPDRDASGYGLFSSSKRRQVGSRGSQLRSSNLHRRQQLPAAWQHRDSRSFAGPSTEQGEGPALSSSRTYATPVVEDPPGIAATPPIAESDLEPIGPFSASDSAFRQRPTPLNMVSVQDASLPSPSLSPITAAASLAQLNNGFSNPGGAIDDTNDVSSLDISQHDPQAMSTELTTPLLEIGRAHV